MERIITSRLHVYVLPVTKFLIPKYLAYEIGDRVIEVFLLIVAFKSWSAGNFSRSKKRTCGGSEKQTFSFAPLNISADSALCGACFRWLAGFLEQSAHKCFTGLSGKEWMGHGTLPLLLGFSWHSFLG